LTYELAQEEGLIVRAIGDVLAICPPLIISDDEIDQLFDRVGAALDRTAAELRRRTARVGAQDQPVVAQAGA